MPALIVTLHRVRRYTRQDFTGFQVLTRERLLLGKLRVWSAEIDREDVPSWATIDKACLGSTDWKSRLLDQYGHLLPLQSKGAA